jgi:hypothetical protein
MQSQDNKAVVRRYFLQGLGGLNPDIVDEVFAPDHILSSPEFGTRPITGTQIIKSAIEEFRKDVGELECTIQSQIEEGDWVATRYTLSEKQNDHMGIMISRLVEGKIEQSHVVATTVSGSDSDSSAASALRVSGSATETVLGPDRSSSARKAFN